MNQTSKLIIYHYVRPIKNSKYPKIKGIELEGFVKQLEYFKNNFNFITSGDFLNCIYADKILPQHSILLTFDDGLKDHYLHVFPILKKLKIYGMFFPSAQAIEDNHVLDVHKIHFVLAQTDNKKKIIDDIFYLINEYRDQYNLNTTKSYYDSLAVPNRFDDKDTIFIKRILQHGLPRNLRSMIVNSLFKEFVTNDEKSFAKDLYLSYEEIHEMREYGMYFGSHGYSHEWLGTISPSELNFEIEESRKFYSRINGNNDHMIMCYPYGSYSAEVIQKLKESEYKVGLTIEVGDAVLNKLNAFTLKRYDTNDFQQ